MNLHLQLLSREMGDVAKNASNSSALQTLLNESTGWRGRQQQILWLQQRVKELEQQLTLYGISAASGKKGTAAMNADPLENFSGATTLGLDLLGSLGHFSFYFLIL